MKRIKFFLSASAIFVSSFSTLMAQSEFREEVSGVGTNAANFLEIGVGARAMAMGGTYAAIANDPTALFYNPAGAAWVNGVQMELMHNNWLVDTKHDFVGIVVPLDFYNSALGLSVISLDYGEQPVRTTARPEGTGELYSANDLAVTVTYATALTDRFSFGLSGKFIRQKIWNESGTTGAIDLGIYYQSRFEGLKLGFSMSNYGNEIGLRGRDLDSTIDPDPGSQNVDRVPVQYKTATYPLPLLFRAGLSYEARLSRFGRVLVAMDLNHPSHAPESVNIGVEYGVGGIFFLRAGHENLFEDDVVNGMTFGGGVDIMRRNAIGVRVDYAYADWGILENSHRFSLGLVFN